MTPAAPWHRSMVPTVPSPSPTCHAERQPAALPDRSGPGHRRRKSPGAAPWQAAWRLLRAHHNQARYGPCAVGASPGPSGASPAGWLRKNRVRVGTPFTDRNRRSSGLPSRPIRTGDARSLPDGLTLAEPGLESTQVWRYPAIRVAGSHLQPARSASVRRSPPRNCSRPSSPEEISCVPHSPSKSIEVTAMSSSATQRMRIGDFLLRRLEETGVRHLFGVPGDYNLPFLQQLQDTGALKWIGTCNELNASYAADGYAAEWAGCATGDERRWPPERDQRSRRLLQRACAGHLHQRIDTAQVHRSWPGHAPHNGRRYVGPLPHAYAPVTAAQARLTPRNAATEIDRLILAAWREKLPVYMELPSDIAYLDIEVPTGPLVLAEPTGDPERLRCSRKSSAVSSMRSRTS